MQSRPHVPPVLTVTVIQLALENMFIKRVKNWHQRWPPCKEVSIPSSTEFSETFIEFVETHGTQVCLNWFESGI